MERQRDTLSTGQQKKKVRLRRGKTQGQSRREHQRQKSERYSRQSAAGDRGGGK